MESIIEKYSKKYKTEHYEFVYSIGSFAEKHINEVAEIQERCFNKITSVLKIIPLFKIKYLLADSPEDLGVIYGDNEPCNGFARMPDRIYAVYTEKIKCIGMHEDAHIISYSRKRPMFNFLREGLAMYFDEGWLGKPNEQCCREIITQNELPIIIDLFDKEKFFALPENITYPVSGAFTKFLIEKLGMKSYLDSIYYNDNAIEEIRNRFDNVQRDFLSWLERF